jgi:hypothetical protein
MVITDPAITGAGLTRVECVDGHVGAGGGEAAGKLEGVHGVGELRERVAVVVAISVIPSQW